MLNVVKIIDQYGWSYDFIGREQQHYTKHNLEIQRYNEVKFDGVDIIYIHSPNICPELANVIPLEAKKKGIKVIGGYGGDPRHWADGTDKTYSHADLLVTISPETYRFAKKVSDVPVIFLPESIDTEFFTQTRLRESHFRLGWAGSSFALKRQEILDNLKYPVLRQSQWGFEHFVKDKNLDCMKKFYHSLNAFVLTSITECMPRVVLEAMSCGLPIISTNVGNLPLLLDKDWIVPLNPHDVVVKEINERLDALKNDFDLQKRIGKRNREFIEDNYSWKKNQPLWDKVFSSVAQGNITDIIKSSDRFVKKHADLFVKPKIAYVLAGTGISGGAAVILQHANMLKEKGYNVFIILQNSLDEEIHWFPNKVPIIPRDTTHQYLFDDIDILFLTSWETVNIDIEADRKVYFVQSDERRFYDDPNMKDLIHRTYEIDFEYMTEAKWIQRWLRQEFRKDAYYVPNGLDQELIYKSSPIEKKSKKTRVLLEGAIAIPFKGVSDAYDAIKDLDCEIWIVSNSGKPDPDWKYDKFFENVPFKKMKHIYSSCDILLKMSKVEGLFGPPLEAMACGCSVVVGKCTGYDEYIEDKKNALVVEQGDIIGAKNAIKNLIDNKVLREKLIENGYQTAKEWSWDKSLPFLENVIQRKSVDKVYTEQFPERYDFSETSIKSINARNKKCDIIVVTKNATSHVKRCIESIKKYTKIPYQLIVVDNDSNYDTKVFLESIRGAKVIYNNKNYGFGYANNQALETSESEYVCFLNSDTIVTENWLERLIKISEKRKAGLVGPVTNSVSSTCQLVSFDYKHNISDNDDSKIQNFAESRYEEYEEKVIETNRLIGFCFLAKKSVLKEVGNFDDRFETGLFEDDDLCLRIVERGYRIFCANGVFIYHFGGESFNDEFKTRTHNELLERNRKIYEEKWYDTNRINSIKAYKKPMSIVYLLASDSPSGGVKIVFEHANRLKARGHKIKIICAMKETGSEWFDLHAPITYSHNFNSVPECDIVIGTYFSTLNFLKKVKARVKIHLCQGYEALLHAEETSKIPIRNCYESVKNKIVVSRWLGSIIENEFGIIPNYISNGIDPYVFSFKEHERNDIPRILIVGTEFLNIKGVDIAIKAIERLNRKIEIVRLSTSRQLNKLKCEYYDMSKMTQEEIARVYKSCDITICASWKVEGFSLPPLESMASGTPVITTDSGGVTDYAINGQNSIVVEAGHPEIITHKINFLLDNKIAYKKFAKNGIETAKDYKWYRKIDELEDFYYKEIDKISKIQNENLSVCMIVKNEEEYLERCLNSIKDVASEIIIIDTGSTDSTVQIAKRFGADIYHFQWNNNFADARNFALDKATREWTLVLDADESIAERDISKLKQLLKKKSVAYNFVTRNYINDKEISTEIINNNDTYEESKGVYGWSKSFKVRLFPTNKKIRFEGKVHELVEKSLKENNFKVIQSEIPIHHFGYLERNIRKEEKYLELGKDKLKENRNDIQSIMELANQYMALNNSDEALVLWRKAIELQPSNAEFHSKMGTTYNLLQNYEQAEKCFLKALSINESEYIYRHLGICYAKQKKYQESYDAYKHIVYHTKDVRTMAEYVYCCNALRKFDESILVIEKRLNNNYDVSWGLLEVAYNEKGIELAKKGKFGIAMQMFQNALRINSNFSEARLNINELNRLKNVKQTA